MPNEPAAVAPWRGRGSILPEFPPMPATRKSRPSRSASAGRAKAPPSTDAASDAPTTQPPAQTERAAPAVATRRRRRRGSIELTSERPRVGASRERKPATKAPPQPAYWFVYYPDRWIVAGEQTMRVIPFLAKKKLLPGADGVGMDREGNAVPAMMRAQVEANGGQFIEWDEDYLVRDKASGGWYCKWESVFAGSTEVQSDVDAYGAWTHELIERGVIEPCPVHVLERLLAQHRNLFAETANKSAELWAHKRHALAIEAIEAELEVARAEEDEAEEDDEAEDLDSDPRSLLGSPDDLARPVGT